MYNLYIVQAAKIRAGSRLTSPWKVPLLAIVVPGKGKEEEESLFTAKAVFPEFVLQSRYKFYDAFKVLCGYIINLVRHCL